MDVQSPALQVPMDLGKLSPRPGTWPQGSWQLSPSPACSSKARAVVFPWLWWDEMKGVTHVQQ